MGQRPASTPEMAEPAAAATIMLLREGPTGVEVLLTERHPDLAYMGGVWVFPGGKREAADCSAALLERIPPHVADRCAARLASTPGLRHSRGEALGLHVTACREAFEEVGVLLARAAHRASAAPRGRDRAHLRRRERACPRVEFEVLLEREGLCPDVGRLVYWANWVTPSAAPRRFDTTFFAAPMPERQTVAVDTTESTDHVWLTPARAIAASKNGTMRIVPPTLVALHELDASRSAHGDVASMLAAEANRPVVRVVPKLLPGEGGELVVLPWDPEYDALPGQGAASAIEVPSRLRHLPSRMLVPSRRSASG